MHNYNLVVRLFVMVCRRVVVLDSWTARSCFGGHSGHLFFARKIRKLRWFCTVYTVQDLVFMVYCNTDAWYRDKHVLKIIKNIDPGCLKSATTRNKKEKVS
jgi:hypothetical protein